VRPPTYAKQTSVHLGDRALAPLSASVLALGPARATEAAAISLKHAHEGNRFPFVGAGRRGQNEIILEQGAQAPAVERLTEIF